MITVLWILIVCIAIAVITVLVKLQAGATKTPELLDYNDIEVGDWVKVGDYSRLPLEGLVVKKERVLDNTYVHIKKTDGYTRISRVNCVPVYNLYKVRKTQDGSSASN